MSHCTACGWNEYNCVHMHLQCDWFAIARLAWSLDMHLAADPLNLMDLRMASLQKCELKFGRLQKLFCPLFKYLIAVKDLHWQKSSWSLEFQRKKITQISYKASRSIGHNRSSPYQKGPTVFKVKPFLFLNISLSFWKRNRIDWIATTQSQIAKFPLIREVATKISTHWKRFTVWKHFSLRLFASCMALSLRLK
jgi:hypothetical protein